MSNMIEEWYNIACPSKQYEWNQFTTFFIFVTFIITHESTSVRWKRHHPTVVCSGFIKDTILSE